MLYEMLLIQGKERQNNVAQSQKKYYLYNFIKENIYFMTDPLLRIVDLEVAFTHDRQTTQCVIDKINLSIQQGETVALLGESGSGKSLTAMSIMRLLPDSAHIKKGNIFFGDQDLLTLSNLDMRKIRGGKIAVIFQEPQSSLNPVLTIGQQIFETLSQHKKLYGVARYKCAIELLHWVEISEPERRINDYPHQFSGGMQQRVMIAMALAGEPDLLIADEPTTALDVMVQAQILKLLQKLQRETGISILFITHDIAVASEMADHVAVMKDGKIIEYASRDEFYKNPVHEYSKELFTLLQDTSQRVSTEQSTLSRENTDQEILLKVSDLKIYFPIKKGFLKRTVDYVRAVDGISIDLHRGQTLAIVGESGSGKTTLGHGILQLLDNCSGSIIFEGEELSTLKGKALRRRRADMQIVFQDAYSSMNPRMLVADIISEGMIAQGFHNQQGINDLQEYRLNRVDLLLEKVGLERAHKNRYPHEFSGGQRQRICIARALATQPKLIVFDEPTSALDISIQRHILKLLKELQKNMQLSYLFVTHDIGVVEYLAHRIAVMYKGRIVEQGSAREVLSQPSHPYTQKLLAAVPKIKK